MSYNITARVFQTNPTTFFRTVEHTVWNYANGGIWKGFEDKHILDMGGSGTSGTLRFLNEDTGEFFLVALGVHNYDRWCDIVPDLTSSDTGTLIHPEYYNRGTRASQRESVMANYSVTSSSGWTYQVNFTVPTGNELMADIIIS